MSPGGSPGISLHGGRPRLAAGFVAEREGRRRYADLAAVAAVAPGRSARRVQYWTFAGVTDDEHREALLSVPVSYDLTVISARPMGWERPKTHGHVHTGRGSPGTSFPELYEVLAGRAGFLVQDLQPGPTSTFAALIEAGEGQVVVLPPLLHHVTVNLGGMPLVVADLVCRASDDDYSHLRAARGMAHYIRNDGVIVPNAAYRSVPRLERLTAAQWSGSWSGPLYRQLVEGSDALTWLCSPDVAAPAAYARVLAKVTGPEGRAPARPLTDT